MAFGRRTGKDGGKRKAGHAPVQPADEHVRPEDTVVASAAAASGVEDQEELQGPFDIDDFDDPSVAVLARLDLGSVLIPMPAAGQVQVELTESGVPSAVWVITPNGRYSIAAYAAPKTGGLWREVAGELADSLRKDSAKVSIKDGPWGREVIGIAAGVVRFIGVDGYRWMIRCVVNGPQETVDALTEEAREALADTVVRRGRYPAAGTDAVTGAPARADGGATKGGCGGTGRHATPSRRGGCTPRRSRIGDAAVAQHDGRLARRPQQYERAA
ncbi:hypothetical alanine and glycine and valine rich protein [Mycobacterium tuberculosis]|nr:hypothetical alanine and glycine and valine rich protein [Mycobacterium tuberculosis]